MAILSEAIGSIYAGVLLFLGMPATFGVLMLVPAAEAPHLAGLPCARSFSFAIFIGMVGQAGSIVFPLLLIVGAGAHGPGIRAARGLRSIE